MKSSDLIGPALDWAVAKIEDKDPLWFGEPGHLRVWQGRKWPYNPSTDWSQGGPIIDREDITWSMNMEPEHGDETRFCAFSYRAGSSKAQAGPTKLIAAMRCYVASKLGDEINIPKELL